MYIRVNPRVINNEVSNIDSNIKDFSTGITNIRNTINNISNIWKGNDFNHFEEKMNTFLQDLNKIEQTLETYKDFLKGYMNAGEKLDNYYNNKKINIK